MPAHPELLEPVDQLIVIGAVRPRALASMALSTLGGSSRRRVIQGCTCDKGAIRYNGKEKGGVGRLTFFTRFPNRRAMSMDDMVRVTAGEFGREVGRFRIWH
jgi:hypothetical protein